MSAPRLAAISTASAVRPRPRSPPSGQTPGPRRRRREEHQRRVGGRLVGGRLVSSGRVASSSTRRWRSSADSTFASRGGRSGRGVGRPIAPRGGRGRRGRGRRVDVRGRRVGVGGRRVGVGDAASTNRPARRCARRDAGRRERRLCGWGGIAETPAGSAAATSADTHANAAARRAEPRQLHAIRILNPMSARRARVRVVARLPPRRRRQLERGDERRAEAAELSLWKHFRFA